MEADDTIYEFAVDRATGEWFRWKECVPTWTYPSCGDQRYFSLMTVPTLDSVRYEALLTLAHDAGKVMSHAGAQVHLA